MERPQENIPAVWKEESRQTRVAGALLLALALGAALLDVFSDPVRDWAVEHVIATTFATSAIVVLFGVLVIDARAQQRERERTDGAVLDATEALYSALVGCAYNIAQAYADAKTYIEKSHPDPEYKGQDGLARLRQRVSSVRRELSEQVASWRFVEHREELTLLFHYCRVFGNHLNTISRLAGPDISQEERWAGLEVIVDFITGESRKLAEHAKNARVEIRQRTRAELIPSIERYVQAADKWDDMRVEAICRLRKAGKLTGLLNTQERRPFERP